MHTFGESDCSRSNSENIPTTTGMPKSSTGFRVSLRRKGAREKKEGQRYHVRFTRPVVWGRGQRLPFIVNTGSPFERIRNATTSLFAKNSDEDSSWCGNQKDLRDGDAPGRRGRNSRHRPLTGDAEGVKLVKHRVGAVDHNECETKARKVLGVVNGIV
jgi:hypothetical protein